MRIQRRNAEKQQSLWSDIYVVLQWSNHTPRTNAITASLKGVGHSNEGTVRNQS